LSRIKDKESLCRINSRISLQARQNCRGERNRLESIQFNQESWKKIVLYTNDPRLRASPRHVGQGVFLNG
jgi:hypothetical protein